MDIEMKCGSGGLVPPGVDSGCYIHRNLCKVVLGAAGAGEFLNCGIMLLKVL